jgi:hypothetical protein
MDFLLQMWWLSSKIPGLKRQKPEDPVLDASCRQYSKDLISKEEKKERGVGEWEHRSSGRMFS